MAKTGKIPILQRRDRWGHGVSLWIIACVVLILPVMFWALRDIKMHNDVVGWLPRNDPQAKILHWYEDLFPSEDRILISWDDCSLTDPRIAALERRLEGTIAENGQREGASPYVVDVTRPTELLSKMLSRDLTFEQSIDRITGVLCGKGPLKIRYTDIGRTRGSYMEQEILSLANDTFRLNAVIEYGDMTLPSSEGIPIDDTRAWKLHDELTKYVQAIPLYDLQISWPEMHTHPKVMADFREALLKMEAPASGSQTAGKTCIEDCFIVPGSLVAVSVALSEAGIADKAVAVEAVHQAIIESGVPEEAIHMGGQPVVNVAMNAAVADAAWDPNFPVWDLAHRSPIFLSALVSILASFVMLRSFRLASLVQLVSILTVVIAMALIPLSGTSLNMVLIVMPTLLIVLTTSAAIHLSNYWKHSGEADPNQSVFQAANTAWLPCALASGTTAIGLASLLVSNLVPVREFGTFASIGCGISFVVVLYVLPSLMLYWPKSPPPEEHLETGHWNRFGQWIVRHRHFVTVACALATIATAWGLRQFATETKIIRYFPPESRLVQDYVFLEDKLSGVISIDTIVKFDKAARERLPFIDRARIVMELQSEIRQHPEISGALSLASFLDLRTGDDAGLSAIERMRLKRSQSALEDKIYKRVHEGTMDDDSVASMLALPEKSADWLESGDRLLNREGDEVWRITAQTSALSDTDLEVLISEMDDIASRHLAMVDSPYTSHIITGLIPVFLRTQQAVLESLISSFGMAFIIIAIVMMVLLRSPVSGVFTMFPNLMPVIMIFGMLSWMNLKVDIGTMITASVALGIAVDGTLHLITWFQELVRDGYSQNDAVAKALENCGPAMWQTSAAIGLGMLALLPAELLLVSRFGWIMAALIMAALLGDIVLLPALLAGKLGQLIQRSELRSMERGANSEGSSDVVSEQSRAAFTGSPQRASAEAPFGHQLKDVS